MTGQSESRETSHHIALDKEARFLTFGVGDEVYAITVFQVREVLDVRKMSRPPNAPDFLLGMIDVRGEMVPVIDLRRKFGLPSTEQNFHSRIMVAEVLVEGRPCVLGMLTDRVYEVTSLDSTSIDAPPEIGVRWNSEMIKGIGRHHDKFVIVLDLNRILAAGDLVTLAR